MLLIFVSMLAIVASLAAVFATAATARVRAQRAGADRAAERSAFVLETMRELTETSRVSSDSLMSTLAARVCAREPAIDAMLVFEPQGEDLACRFAFGPRTDHYSALRLSRNTGDSLAARAANAGHRVAGNDRLVLANDRHALAVPMVDRGGLRAVVYVSSSRESVFGDGETLVRTIEHAAAPYALALERETDRADATYDGLTGLLTPRAFRTRLREEIARRRVRESALLSLWFVDTDHFKTVNDGCGHASGDRVLQEMASLLRSHAVDGVDVVARNGGDEFCALIFGAQKSVAIERAQSFCDAVRSRDFGVPFRVTASVGVASYPSDAQDPNELLEVADAAMYFSKRGGRDRVSFAVDGKHFSTYR